MILDYFFQTDRSGATSIAIEMPGGAAESLIFHYNLKFYDDDDATIDGLSLKRFVMQSVKVTVERGLP